MKITNAVNLAQRDYADLLVVPYWKSENGVEYAGKSLGEFESVTRGPIQLEDFKGKEGEILVVYASGEPENRLALLGLGSQEEMTLEKLRKAYAQVAKTCQKFQIQSLNVIVPDVPLLDVGRGISEGILMINYVFEKLKVHSIKENPTVLLNQITFVGGDEAQLASAKKALSICKGVYVTRDLVNGNADDVTPQHLADLAKSFSKEFKNLKTTVFNKKQLEKEKFGLLLAVSRGSDVDPVLIVSEYKGNPKSEDRTVLVGKGVTFDTGGLNLKKTGSMEDMKYDMAGAATTLGVLHAVATLGLKINLTVVIPSTENSISGKSYKPGSQKRCIREIIFFTSLTK